MEPLVYFDDAGEPEPAVAESWDISDDQTTYTFTIRETTFSNDDPVTADDVVYSLTSMQESPISTYAAAYGAVESITAVDERTVEVELERPSQAFFQGMGGMSGLIQPESAADGIATNPIGTGPYVLDNYATDDQLAFSVNEDYWGEAPSIEDVTVRIIPDGTAALNALSAGEVDVFPVITIDLWERLTTEGFDESFNLVTYPQVGEMLYVAFNSTQAPFDEPEARQALAQAFNREDILAAFNAPWGADATCDFGLEDTSWFAPESAEACPHPSDLDAATGAISAAGLDTQSVEFTSLSDVPDLSLPADILVAQLQQVGADIDRNAIELARYSQTVFQARPPQFGITVMSSAAPITGFACESPDQAGWTTYCSQEFTELLNEADSAESIEEYDDRMAAANEVLKEDAVIVPLAAKNGVGLFHPDLQGWQEPRIMVDIQFKNLHW
ncbi:ABC transporter substrate-binding protein [Sanguibacter sp. Z1732]|uniref:ABC transporter substrate-binding protein n=1 Tax=Sanguibacter sp. Z1732 TaxID=3435412 RepID=UPI003D9CBC08